MKTLLEDYQPPVHRPRNIDHGIGVFDIFPSMIDESLNPILKDNPLSGITNDSLKVKDVVYMPINE